MKEIKLTENNIYMLNIYLHKTSTRGLFVMDEKGNYIKNLSIPETFKYENETYKITCLADNLFAFSNSIKSVTLPKSIKIISEGCFLNSAIEKVILPENLEEIKEFAFFNTKLEKVYLPDSISKIGNNSFFNIKGKIELIYSGKKKITLNSSARENIVLINKSNTLDELIDKNKSFKEINNIYKKEENIR